MSPSASPSHCDASGHTPTTASWVRVYWLTSQARYVRVCLSRRAMHASCESPWHVSAKRHVLGACFSLMAPFRTRFSRYKMAYSANVQRLIGCLYTLRYFYIPPCRFHGTAGYSRCKGRPSHLCFKTVRASFPAHGSSVTEPLSWVRSICAVIWSWQCPWMSMRLFLLLFLWSPST